MIGFMQNYAARMEAVNGAIIATDVWSYLPLQSRPSAKRKLKFRTVFKTYVFQFQFQFQITFQHYCFYPNNRVSNSEKEKKEK